MTKLLALSVLFLASAARADDASFAVPSMPQLQGQPVEAPSLPPAAAPQVLVPLAVTPALSAAHTAVSAAVPSATAPQKPEALKELKQGASSSGQDAAQAPAELQQRFDGSDGKAKDLKELIAGTPVAHNAGVGTFSMSINGEKAFLQYRLRGDRLVILHTEVPTVLEGHGVGGKIVKAALEHAKEKGLKVNPLCPFAAHYIDRHPEYQALLAR